MIGIVDVEIQAQNPEAPLYPMKAYKGSPSSVRVRNAPKRIGDWHLTKVYFSAVYPDGETKTAQCVLTGGVWVGTIAASTMSGTCKNGYTIYADGKDENDNPVVGYVLGKGDVTVMENDGTIEPDRRQYVVHLLSAESDKPLEGDLYPSDKGYAIWQDGEARPLGMSEEDVEEYVEAAVSAKADLSAVPTKVSQLQNDSQYVTKTEVEPVANQTYAGYALKSWTATGLKPVDVEHKILTKNNFVLENYSAAMVIPSYGSKPCHRMNYPYYADWSLSKIGDTTFATPLALKFGYWLIKRTMSLGGMELEITVYDGYGWMSEYQGTENTAYLIGFDDSTKTVKDKLYVLVGETTYGTYTQHTITTSSNGLSVETYDGQADAITCTRANTIKYTGVITLASTDDVEAKLGAYLPLSGGSMDGHIQMGVLDSNRIFFGHHSIVYASPGDIGFFETDGTGHDTRGAYLDLRRTLPLSDDVIDRIAYVRDIRESLSATPTLYGTSGKTVVTTYGNVKSEFDWRGEVGPQTIQDAGLTLGTGATGIAYISFGTEVSSIADETFKNSGVQMVSFSGNIQNIGISAFAGDSRLTMVNCYEDSVASTVSQKTLTIKKHAFAGCAALHHVELPLCFYSIASDAHVFEGVPWNQSQVVAFPNARKGVYLKWYRNGETYARTNLSASLSCDPSLIHTWNPASQEWTEGAFAKSFAFVTATTSLGPSLLQLKGCLDGTNSYVNVSGARNTKIWAGGTANQSDVIAASDTMREMYIKIDVADAYTKTLSWAAYYDKWVGGTKEELTPKAGETAYFHVWEYESQHFAIEKIGAIEQKFSAYLPLSGGEVSGLSARNPVAFIDSTGYSNRFTGSSGGDFIYQTFDSNGQAVGGVVVMPQGSAEQVGEGFKPRHIACLDDISAALSALEARIAALEGN